MQIHPADKAMATRLMMAKSSWPPPTSPRRAPVRESTVDPQLGTRRTPPTVFEKAARSRVSRRVKEAVEIAAKQMPGPKEPREQTARARHGAEAVWSRLTITC
jgi:hypothetical protein